MAIDPSRALELASAIRELYATAETEMLIRVGRRLARGIDRPGWAEAKLAEVTALRAELERIVTGLEAGVPGDLEALLEQAHRAGANSAAAGLGEPLVMVRANPRAVSALLSSTVTRLQGTHLPILRTATDAYRATVAEASALGVTGVQTRRETAWRAMARFADHGVTGFTDSRGRRWDLASYTEMATRTAIGQAHVEGHLGQLGDRGHDLVRVSDSPDECHLCRPFEGKVFSLSGTDPKYPAFATAREGGLFHPGCTHTVAPWIPGLSRPFGPTRDAAGAKERARHRANEREIRHWKRRAAVATAMGDERGAARANAKVREWQTAHRRFIEDTGRRRDYRREQVGGAR